jgi:hypothetical protein
VLLDSKKIPDIGQIIQRIGRPTKEKLTRLDVVQAIVELVKSVLSKRSFFLLDPSVMVVRMLIVLLFFSLSEFALHGDAN